jgi:hypothetical protein
MMQLKSLNLNRWVLKNYTLGCYCSNLVISRILFVIVFLSFYLISYAQQKTVYHYNVSGSFVFNPNFSCVGNQNPSFDGPWAEGTYLYQKLSGSESFRTSTQNIFYAPSWGKWLLGNGSMTHNNDAQSPPDGNNWLLSQCYSSGPTISRGERTSDNDKLCVSSSQPGLTGTYNRTDDVTNGGFKYTFGNYAIEKGDRTIYILYGNGIPNMYRQTVDATDPEPSLTAPWTRLNGTGTLAVTAGECTCPIFSSAPPNVSIINSSCGTGCTLTGGSIGAPSGTPCPALSTLQYQVNGGSWSTNIPTYNQSVPVQNIRTRCACNVISTTVSDESAPVSTVPGTLDNPVVPANGAATVACPALATMPTPPQVNACNGSSITPTGPVITNNPNPITCEGTRTYTWTYTCGSTSSTWNFVYTIERSPFTVPTNGSATVNAPVLATQPVPPIVSSNCGEILIPTGPVVTNNPNPICTGTRTYVWTYTDCEGNTLNWSFIYTIIDDTPPMVTCHNSSITFNGQQNIPLSTASLVTASDNCGIKSTTLHPSSISCAQVGQPVSVTVTVTDLSDNVSICTSIITVGGLPCGWSQQPNGVNIPNGNNISYNANTSVWNAASTNSFYASPFTSDQLAFAQYNLCGNGSITALVTSISGGLGWAGVTMRESNAAGAKKAQLMTNLSAFSRREFRTTTGGSAFPQQFPSQNRYWLRITRTGSQFVMSISPNGTNWYPAGAQNITMTNCVELGLVVTNYNANSTVTATFANVSVTGGNPARPAIQNQKQIFTAADFSIMPNPTSGMVDIDLSSYSQKKVQLDVFNLQGKLLSTVNVESTVGKEELDLTSFANGMYLIRVRAKGLPDVTQRVVLNSNK